MNASETQLGPTEVNKVGQFYSGQWDLLDSLDSINQEARERKLLQALGKDRTFFLGKKVLVAGCAYGWEVLLFHRWGATVIGVDLYVSATIKFLKHFRIDLEKSGIQISQQNIETLDLEKGYYDYIYCNGILHHTEKPEQALANLIEVLRPGGELILGLYGSGGYLWAMVHAGRKVARLLSSVGLGPKRLGGFLLSLRWYRGVWSNRFENESTERVVWTVENLYVPILKNYVPAQVETMLKSNGLVEILRYDALQKKYVENRQRRPSRLGKRLKYGTFELLYSSKKPVGGSLCREL